MKLTLERIKNLIKEELNNLNENKQDLGLNKNDKEKVKKEIFKKLDKTDIGQDDTWEDVLLSKNPGNGIPYEFKGTTYYGEL